MGKQEPASREKVQYGLFSWQFTFWFGYKDKWKKAKMSLAEHWICFAHFMTRLRGNDNPLN